MSRTILVIYTALEAVADRDPGAVKPEELLTAVRKALPEASFGDLDLAADFLRKLASKLKGVSWRINPANSYYVPPAQARTDRHTDGHTRGGQDHE